MHIRDRIKALRRVPAHSLCPNPKNWRTHNTRQRNVLKGILTAIGYADVLLVRELSDGYIVCADLMSASRSMPVLNFIPLLIK